MSTRALLLTEEITPSLRLASAVAVSGSPSPATAMFSRGRQPAAALLGRLGVTPRSLPESTGVTAEEMLLGGCLASGCTDLIMWSCTRGAAAIHALRHLDQPPRVTYVLPREGTSPWDETGVVTTRAGNLIHRFIAADAVTTGRLVDIGIPPSRITPDWSPGDHPTDPPDAQRVLVIDGVDATVAADASRACAEAGIPCARATAAAAVAPALGLGGRPAHLVIDAAAVEAISPLIAAMNAGWRVTVVGESAVDPWPPSLAPCSPDDIADRVAPSGAPR